MYNNLQKTNDFSEFASANITLNESLNDYPTVTLVTYEEKPYTYKLNSIKEYFGLQFYLETISIDKVPLENGLIVEACTYQFTHVSKKALEYPIPVKDFLDKHSHSNVGSTESTYFFPLSTLATYASIRARVGSIIVGNYKVELSKSPSDETVTVRQFLDEFIVIDRKVLRFSGNTCSSELLANKPYIPSNVVSNYTVTYGLNNAYKDAVLSWNNKDRYNDNSQPDRKRYIKQRPVEYMVYEGDLNPHLPPPETNDNSIYPRDLSIMIDNSGITKQCKITKYVWDQASVEVEATFGYAHSALELVDDPSKPNSQSDLIASLFTPDVIQSGNAYQDVLESIRAGKYGYPDDADFVNQMVWRLVELKVKEYIYEPLDITANPKVKKGNSYIDVYVAPENWRFKKSYAQVLVREISNGWTIKRFANEDATNWSKGSIEKWNQLVSIIAAQNTLVSSDFVVQQQYYYLLYFAKVNLEQYLYRKIPLYEQTDYSIEPYSKYYLDGDSIDWQVELMPKNQVNGLGTNSTDEVAVLYPSPNWAPSLMISSRSRYKTAVGIGGNPEYNMNARNYYGSNPLTVTTGTEEFEHVKYLILPSKSTKSNLRDLYTDYTEVENVVSAIQSQKDSQGTYYTPHDYMTVDDYGIKNVSSDYIEPVTVLADLPRTKRKREDYFVELSVFHNASDNSYKSKVAERNYTLAEGRPPGATLRFPVFNEIEEDNPSDNPYIDSTTYITSSNEVNNNGIIASVSIPGASNLQEALVGAAFQLTMDKLSNNSVSATLNFQPFFGRSIINHKIRFDKVPETWVIKSSTQTIQYVNGVALYQPIEVEAGVLEYFTLRHKTLNNTNEDDSTGDDTGEVSIKANLPKKYGISYEDIPNNFSRWVDLS